MSRRAVPAVVLVPLLVVALVVSGSACGTLGSLIKDPPRRVSDERVAPPPLFGGTQADLSNIYNSGPNGPVVPLLDLPLSAGADVALLPVLLALHLWHQGLLLAYPPKPPEPWVP